MNEWQNSVFNLCLPLEQTNISFQHNFNIPYPFSISFSLIYAFNSNLMSVIALFDLSTLNSRTDRYYCLLLGPLLSPRRRFLVGQLLATVEISKELFLGWTSLYSYYRGISKRSTFILELLFWNFHVVWGNWTVINE